MKTYPFMKPFDFMISLSNDTNYFVRIQDALIFSQISTHNTGSGLFSDILHKYFNDKYCNIEDFLEYLNYPEMNPNQVCPRTKVLNASDLNGIPPESQSKAWYVDAVNHKMYIYQHPIATDFAMLPCHRVTVKLIPQFWPGWEVQTVTRGYVEILEHVGYQNTAIPEIFYTLSAEDLNLICNALWEDFFAFEMQIQNVEAFQTHVHDEIKFMRDIFLPRTQLKDDPKFVYTVIKNQQISDYFIPKYRIGFHLSCSRYLLDYLDQLPQREVTTENDGDDAGIIINIDEKKVCYWIAGGVDPIIEDQMKKIWHGWDVSWHIKGLPYQFYLTGRDPRPLMMPYEEVWENMKRFLGGERFEDWLSREEYYELWDTI